MIVHVSSQAAPGEREAGCPCPKSECGRAVLEYDERNLRTGGPCRWHGQSPVAPFKGWHCAKDCPDAPVGDAPLEVRGVIEGAHELPIERAPAGLAQFVTALSDAGWELHSLHRARGEILQKRYAVNSRGEKKLAVRPTVVTSVVARMSKGYARAVMVYEGGTAAAGWRRRTWASNWEEIGVRALQSWAVGQ